MTKTTDIPEAILSRAQLFWQDALTVDNVFTGDGNGSRYVPIIARAMMAQIETDARIAQEAFATMGHDGFVAQGPGNLVRRIFNAIRAQAAP